MLYVRSKLDPDATAAATEIDLEFGLSLTATLGSDQIYGGFSLGISTVSNSTTFGIGLGFPFGGR